MQCLLSKLPDTPATVTDYNLPHGATGSQSYKYLSFFSHTIPRTLPALSVYPLRATALFLKPYYSRAVSAADGSSFSFSPAVCSFVYCLWTVPATDNSAFLSMRTRLKILYYESTFIHGQNAFILYTLSIFALFVNSKTNFISHLW